MRKDRLREILRSNDLIKKVNPYSNPDLVEAIYQEHHGEKWFIENEEKLLTAILAELKPDWEGEEQFCCALGNNLISKNDVLGNLIGKKVHIAIWEEIKKGKIYYRL
jgi:hypothetical protein